MEPILKLVVYLTVILLYITGLLIVLMDTIGLMQHITLQQKLKINHTRQDTNYSMANKTEDDNKSVGL